MGKKEQAREVARAHQFHCTTQANSVEVLAVLDAAAAAASSGLKGRIERTAVQSTATGFDSSWVMKGPGGVVQIMSFVVRGHSNPAGATMDVGMEIGRYLYQKGSLLSKPTLNGGGVIRRFGEIVVSELTRTSV